MTNSYLPTPLAFYQFDKFILALSVYTVYVCPFGAFFELDKKNSICFRELRGFFLLKYEICTTFLVDRVSFSHFFCRFRLCLGDGSVC